LTINHNNLVYMEHLQVVKLIIMDNLFQRLVQTRLEEETQIKKVTFQLVLMEARSWLKFLLYMLNGHVLFWISLVKDQINLHMHLQIIQVT